MPTFETMGPASTPQLVLENQYRRLQQQTADWEKGLRSQGLDEQSYAQAIQDMQKQLNGQIAQFRAKADQLKQTRGMADAGLMDEQAAMRANWEAILPDEVLRAMYPKQPEVSKREPLSTGQMKGVAESVEEFAGQLPKTTLSKRYGAGGIDILAKDVRGRSQADTLKKYHAWKDFIGYEGLTPVEQKQVDTQWDSWIASQKGIWKWNPDSRQIKAVRAKGPLTRAYGRQFRQTPTGPREATDPLQVSIAQAIPKKKNQPTAEELRQKGTQEAYELGKGLGYWN